jgi:hypothetical protein
VVEFGQESTRLARNEAGLAAVGANARSSGSRELGTCNGVSPVSWQRRFTW